MQFKTQPRDYQLKTFEQVKDLKQVLFAIGMSGGKTKIVIDLHNYHNFQKTVVVVPNTIKKVWEHEFEKHSAKEYQVIKIHGTPKQKVLQLQDFLSTTKPSVLVVSYNSLWRASCFDSLLRNSYKIDAMILDESHNIQNPSSNQARACVMLGKHIQYRYALTGTVGTYLNIFAQFKFINPAVLGTSAHKFKEKYCLLGGFQDKEIVGYKNIDELENKILPYWAHIPQDVIDADLPESTHEQRFTQLTGYARKLYDRMVQDGIVTIEEYSAPTSNTLDKIIRLREIVSGYITAKSDNTPVQIEFDHTKLQLLRETCSDIGNEPLVIFVNTKRNLEVVKTTLKELGHNPAELSGKVNQLEDWNNGIYNSIVVNTQAGNAGISLVKSCYNIYFDLPQSLTYYLQSLKRTHRSGQTRTVTNIYLMVKDTIDEMIFSALQKKINISNYLLEQLEKKKCLSPKSQ